MNAAESIRNMVHRLNVYRDAYYNRNQSMISDREYDALFDELLSIEAETGIIYANSPTQTVGYESVSALKKVRHSHPPIWMHLHLTSMGERLSSWRSWTA